MSMKSKPSTTRLRKKVMDKQEVSVLIRELIVAGKPEWKQIFGQIRYDDELAGILGLMG